MKRGNSFLFCLLLTVCASAQEQVVIINPDSLYVEADATQAQIEAVSSISNVSDFELNVSWQWNTIELPQGWSVEFCENNGCFSSPTDTVFLLGLDETAQLSAIFYPSGSPGAGKIKIRLYSASPGIHFEEMLTIVVTATGPTATVQEENNAGISLFPNPADEILNIEVIDKTLEGRWQIIDSRGCIIPVPQDWLSGKVRVSEIPAGKYYLRLLSPENKLLAVKPFLVIH